jgi:hypothetical protein
VLPQALEIIFEMKKKRNNEKIKRKKKAFQLTKYDFLSLWTSLIFKPHNFFNS